MHKTLELDPWVTSGDHLRLWLRAMCALAELKSLIGQHDEAICLLESVLQNDPDAQSEQTATGVGGGADTSTRASRVLWPAPEGRRSD